MKKDELFESMNEVDDKYIEIADNYKGKKKITPYVRWIAMAACICLAVGITVVTRQNKTSTNRSFTKDVQTMSPASIATDTYEKEDVVPSIQNNYDEAFDVDSSKYEATEEWFAPSRTKRNDDYSYRNNETYEEVTANGFKSVYDEPLSTFSADVDTASYSNVRRMLEYGYPIDEIPNGSVRTEEFLNYFSYDYKGPKKGEPFGVNAQISKCPWNEDHDLLMLGLQTQKIDFSDAPNSNIVLLIDVSGSMDEENKLPLLIKSFELLIDNLTQKDRISIVTYASEDRVVLEGVPASKKEVICDALESLTAGGSTNGSGGITAAYDLAEEYFIKGGNNRVIIATDGDFNVGLTSKEELFELVTEEKEKGIYLSCLGFGMGNYNDVTMETLADDGNGNYAYIDSLTEAKKVLVEELGATLLTVAKDVKLQVEFNPLYVSEYRLIGYENRVMAAQDFNNDAKDAGEIGAGHSVTVMYELVPAGQGSGDLKYQQSQNTISDYAKNSDEWLTLKVRYKEPDEDTSKLLEYNFGNDDYKKKPTEDFVFASCVAEFAMVITDDYCLADGSLEHVKSIIENMDLDDPYKKEFQEMVGYSYKSNYND